MNTATTFATLKESWPKRTPMKRVKRPEVEDSTVVLATLVLARAAFDKYCNQHVNNDSKYSFFPLIQNMKPKLKDNKINSFNPNNHPVIP